MGVGMVVGRGGGGGCCGSQVTCPYIHNASISSDKDLKSFCPPRKTMSKIFVAFLFIQTVPYSFGPIPFKTAERERIMGQTVFGHSHYLHDIV